MCLSCFVRILFCSSCLSAWCDIVVFRRPRTAVLERLAAGSGGKPPGTAAQVTPLKENKHVWCLSILKRSRSVWWGRKWCVLHWLGQLRFPRPKGWNPLRDLPLMWCSSHLLCALDQRLLLLCLPPWSERKDHLNLLLSLRLLAKGLEGKRLNLDRYLMRPFSSGTSTSAFSVAVVHSLSASIVGVTRLHSTMRVNSFTLKTVAWKAH